jgi:hypothetical protein
MRWLPLVTFIQTGMDALSALLSAPGDFGSYGHDYRADMARFVRDAYRLPDASDEQLARVELALHALESERIERIKAEHAHQAPRPPAHRADHDTMRAGVPLRARRTHGPRWRGARPARPGRGSA